MNMVNSVQSEGSELCPRVARHRPRAWPTQPADRKEEQCRAVGQHTALDGDAPGAAAQDRSTVQDRALGI